MSLYLICLTAKGGFPIFTRKKGNFDDLPFSTVASLNGFHLFFKSLGLSVSTTYAENWTYLWRDFNNSITIIICAQGIGESTIELLAELVFCAISLFMGPIGDEMSDPLLLELMKKESKHYFPIVDVAMETCVGPQFLGFSNCILAPESQQLLQNLYEEFCVHCGLFFCCFVVNKRIAAATDGWWDLDIVDRQLLLFILQSSNILHNDVTIYLPKKSPNVAYRFISISVSSYSTLCVIGGEETSLKKINDIAEHIFRTDINLLQNIEQYITRNMPEHITLDPNILAIVFANTLTKKCVFSSSILHQNSATKRVYGIDYQNMDLLKMYVGQALKSVKILKRNRAAIEVNAAADSIDVNNIFWSSDNHKCNVQIDKNHNVICLLFVSSIPTYTMKYISKKIFTQILQKKAICW